MEGYMCSLNPVQLTRQASSESPRPLENIAHEPSCSIIAVHGYGSRWDLSWTDGGARKLFWLGDVLPEILSSCRIISYECANLSRDLAERDANSIRQDLMSNRRTHNRSQAPIIFLGENFGGSFLKEMFVSSSPQRNQQAEVQEFHACIRGFAFFSTPQGAQVFPDSVKSSFSIMKNYYTLGLSSRVNELHKIFKQIPSINSDFRNLWGERIQSICFYDTVDAAGYGIPLAGLSIATMSSSSSEKVPLHVGFSQMTKFESRDDPNLLTVLNYLQILFQRAQQPTIAPGPVIEIERTQEEQSGLRILSLDGGGVRGLFSIMVLEKILEEVHHLEGYVGSTPKPCEVFNLIGGTSTGGLLAIMLGRLQMDIISCKQAYRNMSADIFRRGGLTFPGKQWADAIRGVSWFSGDALKAAIRQVVRERIGPTERTHLRETGRELTEAPLFCRDESAPKCFVCAIVDATHECVRLRTYNSNSGADDLMYTIWEAGRATSAAPLYFPPMEIQGHRYYDGGMQSNNPILEAIEEAYLLYGADAPIRAIVSIGTGKSESHEPSGNLFRVMKSLSARTTNTEAKHDEFLRRYGNLGDSYFRLQNFLRAYIDGGTIWYHYPHDAEQMSFGDIFLDLHEKASRARHSFACKFTKSMTDPEVSLNGADAWLPSKEQPDPECLGDFLKLFGQEMSDPTPGELNPIHLTKKVAVIEDLKVFDESPEELFEILEAAMQFSKASWSESHRGGELSKYGSSPDDEWVLKSSDAARSGFICKDSLIDEILEVEETTVIVVRSRGEYVDDESISNGNLVSVEEADSTYVTLLEQSRKILDAMWCGLEAVSHDKSALGNWKGFKRDMQGKWSRPLPRTLVLLAAMVGCEVGLSAATWIRKRFVPVLVHYGDGKKGLILGLLAKYACKNSQDTQVGVMYSVGRHLNSHHQKGFCQDLVIVDPETKVPVGIFPDFLPHVRSDEMFIERATMLYESVKSENIPSQAGEETTIAFGYVSLNDV